MNTATSAFIYTLAASLSLVLAGCQGSPPSSSPIDQKDTQQGVRVAVVQPTIQPVSHTLNAVGSFLAEDEVTISAEVDGRVAQLMVDEGYPLEKGQVLLQLEQERPRLEVQRAEATVREARADLELQEVTLKRRAELLKEEIIPQQVYDNVAARAKLAKARLEHARAMLRLARKSLTDTTILSPLHGIVSERHVAVGEYIKRGEPLCTAVKTDPLKLSFTLPERLTSQVHRDQTVRVTVKAYPDRNFSGQIYFINPQVNPETRALQIKALVDNRDGLLKPGFFADVSLLLNVNEQAVVVPQEAVVLRDDQAFAYIVEDGIARERVVDIGERFDGKVEILSGIRPEDMVVTDGNYGLRDGRAVSVVNRTKPADAT